MNRSQFRSFCNYGFSLGAAIGLLLFSVPGFAQEPTKTPAEDALRNASQAFIGKVISQKEVASPSQYRTIEATVEVLIPLLGAVPSSGSNTQLLYHTEIAIDPCLEIDRFKDGFVGLFTFAKEQGSWSEPRLLNYCLNRSMDLVYEISNPEAAVSKKEGVMLLRLVSGWWSGELPMPLQIPDPQVSSYDAEPL